MIGINGIDGISSSFVSWIEFIEDNESKPTDLLLWIGVVDKCSCIVSLSLDGVWIPGWSWVDLRGGVCKICCQRCIECERKPAGTSKPSWRFVVTVL